MPLAAVDRVIYGKNPLDNVICQARFPTILRIDAEVPSAFQQRLLPDYVNLTQRQEFVVDVQTGQGPSGPAANEIRRATAPIAMNYEFATEDSRWSVNLTRNFISLSTTEYVRWEEFRRRFEAVLHVFVDVYRPVHFTRIGLRYVDVIVRSQLGLDSVDWDELVTVPLLGVLGSDDVRHAVKQFHTRFVMEMGEGQGLVRVTAETVESAESREICFMIDSDYYSLKRRKSEELLPEIEYFHSRAFELFRWCITDRLHDAMRPERLHEDKKGYEH